MYVAAFSITHSDCMVYCVQDGDSEATHCRAVVAVEMLSLVGNRIWDFPDCPSLNNVSHK